MAIPVSLVTNKSQRELVPQIEGSLRKLAREIAMGILPLENILTLHGLTADEFTNLQDWPAFMKMLAEETEIWQTALNTKQRVEIKTWSMLEEALPAINRYLHSPDFSDSGKVGLIGALQKQVGIGVKETSSMGINGERISITINTGSSELKLTHEAPTPLIEGKIVEGKVVEPEGQPETIKE
jgi:hypothetical protein